MAAPSIACLGVIGKNNNPLHISIFPSYNPLPSDGVTFYSPIHTPLQFSLLLSSSLDIFAARLSSAQGKDRLSGEYGLLTTIDDRLSLCGFETNTGVKFVVVVDARGRKIEGGTEDGSVGEKAKKGGGMKEGDMKLVFKAMQTSYIRLLQNPFYDPDEHAPPTGRGGKKITSHRFDAEMQRIAKEWGTGTASL